MAEKIPLKHPIPLADNKELTSLTMRDYTTAADYLTFDLMGGHEQRIHLVAGLCGTEPEVIKMLRGVDYQILKTKAEDLLLEDDKALAEALNESNKALTLEGVEEKKTKALEKKSSSTAPQSS